MGASKSVVFEVRLPSLRHEWPCETCVPMNIRGKSLHGSSSEGRGQQGIVFKHRHSLRQKRAYALSSYALTCAALSARCVNSVFLEVWLPSLRHKWPCETHVPMTVRGKSLHGSSRTFKGALLLRFLLRLLLLLLLLLVSLLLLPILSLSAR